MQNKDREDNAFIFVMLLVILLELASLELDEVVTSSSIPPPSKILNPPSADMSKHYICHRNNDHTMDECKALQDKIEDLICFDHLKRFVRSDEEGSSQLWYSRETNRTNHQPGNRIRD